jgi:hypothetical protein
MMRAIVRLRSAKLAHDYFHRAGEHNSRRRSRFDSALNCEDIAALTVRGAFATLSYSLAQIHLAKIYTWQRFSLRHAAPNPIRAGMS